MAVNIKIDDREIKNTLKKLDKFPKQVPKAASAAINRTITFTNKKVSQEVRKIYNIKAGDIKSSIKIKKATPSNLSGEINSSGRRLTLKRFSKTNKWKRGKPIKVKVKKTGAKVVNTSPKAFMTSLNGNGQILKRKGSSQYPVEVLHTLSVPQMISNVKVSDVVMEEAKQVLKRRIEHEVEHRLSRLGG